MGHNTLALELPGHPRRDTVLDIGSAEPVVFTPVFGSRPQELGDSVVVIFKSAGSNTEGAEILVNNEPTGKNVPDNLKLKCGVAYRVQLRLNGKTSKPRTLKTNAADVTYRGNDFVFP
jgi:hypothetical protein